ncbi:MAG: hypothetical protein IPL96_04930 [Holophagaceae bacterium]|nr:hypothetical protein [Holophagaceae bacterium]
MSIWPSNQSPAWRYAGLGLLLLTGGLTAVFVGRGPGPLKASQDRSLFGSGPKGLQGTLTESFGKGRLVLAYGSVQGQREDLRLDDIVGRLEEDAALWVVRAPRADRKGESWTLSGPLTLEAVGAGEAPLGHGRVREAGPAIRWLEGAWQGLSPLEWTDTAGKGQWHIPAGWKRDLEGRLSAHGPIRWTPLGPGPMLALEAQGVEATPGFQNGSLEDAHATFQDGSIKARRSLLEPRWIRWPAALTFARADGWTGSASGGQAPRPEGGDGVDSLELKDFRAERTTPEGAEQLQALGARWTPQGLRLEGSVIWEQPLQGLVAKLVAPRLLMRNEPGGELPPELGVGQAWAEGQAVLTWGNAALGVPGSGLTASGGPGTWMPR